MSADKYRSVQREAFGTLVKEGAYGVDFSHAPATVRFFTQVFEEVLASVQGGDRISVLDCGCGPGAWLDVTDKVAGTMDDIDLEIFGFDITPEMVEVAKKRFSGRVAPVHFREGDILNDATYEFPGQSGRFDIIFAYDVIQQLPRSLQFEACTTMLGRLAPGGVFLIFDHDSQSSYGRRMAFKKFVTRYMNIKLVPRYYCNAKYPALRRIAAALTRDGSFAAEIHQEVSSNKCALIIQAA